MAPVVGGIDSSIGAGMAPAPAAILVSAVRPALPNPEEGGSTRINTLAPGGIKSEKEPLRLVCTPFAETTPLTIDRTVAPATLLSTPVVPFIATTLPVMVLVAVKVTVVGGSVTVSTLAVTVSASTVESLIVTVATPLTSVVAVAALSVPPGALLKATVLPGSGALETSRTVTEMALVLVPSARTEAGLAAIDDWIWLAIPRTCPGMSNETRTKVLLESAATGSVTVQVRALGVAGVQPNQVGREVVTGVAVRATTEAASKVVPQTPLEAAPQLIAG